MNFTGYISRVRNNVNDVNGDTYTPNEVEGAINSAKDEVFGFVRTIADTNFHQSNIYAFTDGLEYVAIDSGTQEVIRIEQILDSAEVVELPVCAFQVLHLPQYVDHVAVVGQADGTVRLYRSQFKKTEVYSVRVYYVTNISDQSTVGAGFTTFIPLMEKLTIIKATIELLASRRRDKAAALWINREVANQIELRTLIKKRNKNSPRYVNYVA